MKKISFLLLALLYSSVLHSQVQLISEKIQENKYTIEIKILDNSYLVQKNGREILVFPNLFDESKPGSFTVENSNILVSLPLNSTPKLSFETISETSIAALPDINPLAQKNEENNLEYKQVPNPVQEDIPLITFKGYIQVENQYCAHLTISPYKVDYQKRHTRKTNELKIVFTFSSAISAFSKTNPNSNYSAIINNGSFGINARSKWISNNNDSWIDYNRTYVKLGTATDNVFRVTYDDLFSLGLNPSLINPKSLRLIKKGIEVPVFVKGEADLSFDNEDFIEFVGERNMGGNHRSVSQYNQPYIEYLDRYSDTTIYWLTWGGTDGLRVQESDSVNSILSQDTVKYYHEIIHYEKNNWFDFSMADQVRREMPNWYENKTWHEGNLGVGTRNSAFAVTDVYPDKPFYVFSKQQSYASNINQSAHLLAISVNSSALQDSGFIDKYGQKLLKGEYNSSILNNGNNTLKIFSFPTSASPNLCIYDWHEVEYPR